MKKSILLALFLVFALGSKQGWSTCTHHEISVDGDGVIFVDGIEVDSPEEAMLQLYGYAPSWQSTNINSANTGGGSGEGSGGSGGQASNERQEYRRIYTPSEAASVANDVGNTFMIRYR